MPKGIVICRMLTIFANMEQYIVSARKYRPTTFSSVVGQRALTGTLKNAIATDRLAHAYLFCGSRGIGKTSCARIFAKTINCANPTADGEACNECESCRSFNEGRSMNIVELDAASNNGIDDIREVIEMVQMPPTHGRSRVFIIDEVHMLSSAAFNAFLKTLEEPPSYVIFILATTEKHKIIPTILSRCQIYDFNRITVGDIADHLASVAANEGISAERAALNVIARKADGAMRDALSIFDQVAASSKGDITYASTIANLNILDSSYYGRLLDAFVNGDVPAALLIYKEIRERGFDSLFFVNGLAQYLRDLMVAQNPVTVCLLEDADEVKAEMAATAAKCPPQFLYRAMALCNDADLNYRAASNKQFLVELTLIKLCQSFSPSPGDGDNGEGRLKPIVTTSPTAKTSSAARPTVADSTTSVVKEAAAASTSAAARPISAAATDTAATVAMHNAAAGTSVRPGRIPLPKISLRHGLVDDKNSAGTSAATTVAREKRTQAYSAEAVKTFWESYIQSHPSAKVIINTMRAAKPRHIGGDSYVMTVDSEIQANVVKPALPDIVGYMRDRLLNDNFDVIVEINTGESSPMTWTEREVYNYMIKENKAFAEFAEEFKLTLL